MSYSNSIQTGKVTYLSVRCTTYCVCSNKQILKRKHSTLQGDYTKNDVRVLSMPSVQACKVYVIPTNILCCFVTIYLSQTIFL